MSRNRTPARRLLSALGLATASVLAFGVFTAGAAQAASWHIDGKSFQEMGLASVSFASSGTFETDVPDWGYEMTCSEEASGKISASGAVEESVSLSGCYLEGAPKCQVAPTSMELAGTAEALYSTDEYLVSFEVTKCAAGGVWDFTDPPGGLGMQYGSEAVELAAGSYGEGGYGAEPVYFSGSSSWELVGSVVGHTLGYW